MNVARRLARRRVSLAVGLALLAVVPSVLYAPATRFAEGLRETAFDLMSRVMPRRQSVSDVVFLDIDRPTLAAFGRWPWPRAIHGRLLEAVADGKPAVVAFDILLGAGRPDEIEDARRLAKAIASVPTVLGMVLDPIAPADQPPAAPLLFADSIALSGLMQEDGVAAPPDFMREAAAGLGIISLGAADSPVVRAAPLFAVGGDRIYAGLALEAVRVSRSASSYIAVAGGALLRVGDMTVRLDDGASLRLHLASETVRRRRTLSARDVVEGGAARAALSGQFGVVGSSAPELGGLRSTPADAFVASGDIQATAIEQLLAGQTQHRPFLAQGLEVVVGVLFGVAALIAAVALPPFAAGLAVGIAALVLCAGAVVLFLSGSLVDPFSPSIVGLVVFQGTALASFAEQRRQRAEIEQRFAQHLPPEVVKRIADDPAIVRLEGEERVVTALFTDIEGFTALGERADPRDVVRLLDTYVERVCAVVVEHGGTVDKIVGDAIHAFFNAPIDLPDHPAKAVTCALAIIQASEVLRREPLAASLRLGRTRIGIETGPAIVGNVGGGRRFDYTAHGAAVNTAAKLEASNKRFGSSIAVGPTATALAGGIPFRPLGRIQPADTSEPILACEPWPGARGEDILHFREAFEAITKDRRKAAAIFEALGRRYPDDPVIEGWRERLAEDDPSAPLT